MTSTGYLLVGVAIFFLLLGALALIKGFSMLTLWLEEQEEHRKTVKRLKTVAMSTQPSPSVLSDVRPASVLRTDNATLTPLPPNLTYTEEQKLYMYRLLRELGVSRDDARAHLKTIEMPVSNDLWTKAAPPPKSESDDELITPYAGRRTKASYYPDAPELEFQEAPR